MQFKLLFSGRLLGATKTKTRADAKHAMRREMHPQLRRLWMQNSQLKSMIHIQGKYEHAEFYFNAHTDAVRQAMLPDLGVQRIANKWQRNGFRFVPLVTEGSELRCSLDILFLRPEDDGLLRKSGDIDGRMKTVFDALRMPSSLDETGGMGPQEDEDPFFCLLEDDRLVTDISISTDQLLLLPHTKQLNANEVFLVINVKITGAARDTLGHRLG